jgi:hypothetical protein
MLPGGPDVAAHPGVRTLADPLTRDQTAPAQGRSLAISWPSASSTFIHSDSCPGRTTS